MSQIESVGTKANKILISELSYPILILILSYRKKIEKWKNLRKVGHMQNLMGFLLY